MEKIRFISTQFGLFFDKPIDRPEILLSDFTKEMGDIFDQSPLTLPVPNSPEFNNLPVVQFISNNGLYTCTFARKRADYFHFSSDRKKQYEFNERKDALIENVEKYFNFFKDKTSVNRIGFLTKFFIKDEQQKEVISNLIIKDFKEIQGGDIRDTKLQYTSRMKTKDGKFELNNVTAFEKTKIALYEDSKEVLYEGILITRDFNTIPEKADEYKGKFNTENIKNIIIESEENFKLDDMSKLLWTTTPTSNK